MKDETKKWLEYADENLRSARLLLDSELFNPCLQNVQQAVEKMLKALLMESTKKIKKTHSINELVNILDKHGLNVDMTKMIATCSIQYTFRQSILLAVSCRILNRTCKPAGNVWL